MNTKFAIGIVFVVASAFILFVLWHVFLLILPVLVVGVVLLAIGVVIGKLWRKP
jgi:hypothetical protein